MAILTRRDFVRQSVLAVAAAQLASELHAAPTPAPPAMVPLKPGVADLHWLDGTAPEAMTGATWGVPWPQGLHAPGTGFSLRTAAGAAVPVQSWPLAYWPDGSLKWTGHALPADAPATEGFELAAGSPAAPARPLAVQESADAIDIDTGVIQCRVGKGGESLIPQILREGRVIARDGRLVCLREDRTDRAAPRMEPFAGTIARVSVEQSGPIRAVVKIEGRHRRGDRSWLPFVVRLYFYAGGDAVRMLHTIVYDGNPQQDFIRGLGIRFDVPLRGALHDRHVRFSGQTDGLFAEAVRGVTGLRRDPGAAVKEAQLAGRATPPLDSWPKNVSGRMNYIPAFADWTLFQSSSDGYEIRKRTADGYTWLSSARGSRAGGLGYVGTPDGGVAFGLRNFWQSHPAQLDIRGATGEVAEITAWLWSPVAAAMDLRPYHNDLGEDTYAKQVEAMDITYEDYEPGFDSPEGVARTSELYFWALSATPAREQLVRLAGLVRQPPVVANRPEHLQACGVFGGLWSPVDRSTPARSALEDQLDWYFKYYQGQQEQRRWYGFWNYGDVMHTYDGDRHEWRYDVGGFAWDNSELSTDLWLWLFFLRTGRADVFRFAEAMTRHTGEVDVHHLGRFAPLGSRHNVLHWGCSAKQLRISNAANRRYFYYLTADERVGDLMREQVEAGRALVNIQPNRKAGGRGTPQPPDATATHARVGFGTDWGALSAAWLTEWERTGDAGIRDRLRTSMSTIGRQPRGFFSSGARMDLATGAFDISPNDRAGASHLSAVFGLVEVCAELVQLLDVPEFKQAWVDYCELYNAPAEEQAKRLGSSLSGISLQQGHSRLTAFAAKAKGDPALAQRAWKEFFRGEGSYRARPEVRRVAGPAVLQPVDEAAFVSTNATAQWGLAAIQNLALAGEALPPVLISTMKLSRIILGLSLLGAAALASPTEYRFTFGSGPVGVGRVPVRVDTAYSAARGYGFEAGAAVMEHEGCCTSERPFFFSADLPEGNYRVQLRLGDPVGESQTVVKAESRRLMLESVATKKGEVATATFLVNIRTPQIPGGGQVRLKSREIGALHWDQRLTLEFNGARPCVAALEISRVDDAPTVFLAGDSTVTDQQLEPWAAWGQMLPAFFGPTVAIANHAESGETIKSFVGERRFDRVMSLIRPGDWLFMQFGHNDQKMNAEHTDAATGYKDLLRRFIAETRAKGAQPVLVTSMERRNFDAAGRHIVPSLAGYPQAIREVGGELNVPVIDLNALSIPFYEALGPEAAKQAFVHFPANSYPGQDKALADDTHFSSYGAYQLAKCVVEGIKARVPALAAHLRPGLAAYDPAHPDRFADWHLPASPPKPVVKPEGS